MINLSAVANEVYQILRQYDYTVMMYDDEGMEVFEPEDARRFFAKPENLMVSLVEDNDDSCIHLYLSGSTDIESVLGLIQSLTTAANKYNMIFDNQKWDRDLSVKDFASKSSVRENAQMSDNRLYTTCQSCGGEYHRPNVNPECSQCVIEKDRKAREARGEFKSDLTEGMYGTSKSSYLKLENARMIVRHSAKIDETVAGARSRRVESIFVENAQGERFLFPTKQLAPARAMTQHLNHGGAFADEVGQHINQMATDYAALGQASSFIGMNQPVLGEGAVELREKCRTSRKGMRRCFERLYRESSYAREADAIREAAANPVLVEDATIEHLREMLAIEGKELSEDVISTIARCVESAQPVLDEALAEPAPVDEPEVGGEAPEETHQPKKRAAGPTVKVLGKDVDQEAWEKFKNGRLDLRANPESIEGPAPKFANKAAEVAFRLRSIAPLCMDDTMSNLLSWAAEELPMANDKLLRQLMTLGTHACETLHVPVTEGLGFRGVRAIREFEEWFDSMGSDRVLSPLEDDVTMDAGPVDPVPGEEIAPPPSPATEIPNIGAPEAPLVPEAPLEVEHDWDSMAADIANGYTEGATWRLNFPEKDRAAEVVGEKTSLIQISNAVLGGSDEGSVHSDPSEGPRQSFHWNIDTTVTAAPVPAPVSQAPMVPPSMGAPATGPVDPMMGDPMGDPMMGESEEGDNMLDEYNFTTRGGRGTAPGHRSYSGASAPIMKRGIKKGFGLNKGHGEFSNPTNRDKFLSKGEETVAEEAELTREDILLPKNQGADLKQEVGHPVSNSDEFGGDEGDKSPISGDEEEGGLTMERLRKLSGIRIS